jgi:hypothetical protein
MLKIKKLGSIFKSRVDSKIYYTFWGGGIQLGEFSIDLPAY